VILLLLGFDRAVVVDGFVVVKQAHHTSSCRARRSSPPIICAAATTIAPAATNPDVVAVAGDDNDDDKSVSDTDAVEFPPPLTKVDRLKRAATFWSAALPIVASYLGKDAELRFREAFLGEQLTEDYKQLAWDAQHEMGAATLAQTIASLKGFYVKTAQIISSRQDLFPEQYTEALSGFTDQLDPMDPTLAKAIIEQELLHRNEKFDDVFLEFDDEPLGSASIAQVHRAVLSEAYGGPREVAIKIQRPSIESKLLGDIANLKAISKTLRDALPLDYYTVFSELEKQLADEFDFVAEAVSMDRIYNAITTSPDGKSKIAPPLVMPRPVAGLISKRVLVMDFLRGVPLSRAREEMKARGIEPDSPESLLFGRKLLSSLTHVFGRTILETGFFHADPHPGNIFVLEDGRIGLIDFGQVKQIAGRKRETLAKVMVALDEREGDANPYDLNKIGQLALELGVEFNEDSPGEAYAAVAMWLFDGTVEQLPGGYDKGELSPNSPVREIKSFPEDLVLVGRSTILIKAVSNRMGIPWSLAKEWAPIARNVLTPSSQDDGDDERRTRFRDVVRTFRSWSKSKADGAVRRLPSPLRTKVAALVLRVQERRERRKLMKKPRRSSSKK